MSEHIKLDYGREIRQWMEAHPPEPTELKFYSVEELLALPKSELEGEPKQVPQDGDYYGVEHRLFTPAGEPILSVARVYIAKSAEEALQQYVHGSVSQLTGKGVECAFTKNWQQYTYEMQEIEVSQIENERWLAH